MRNDSKIRQKVQNRLEAALRAFQTDVVEARKFELDSSAVEKVAAYYSKCLIDYGTRYKCAYPPHIVAGFMLGAILRCSPLKPVHGYICVPDEQTYMNIGLGIFNGVVVCADHSGYPKRVFEAVNAALAHQRFDLWYNDIEKMAETGLLWEPDLAEKFRLCYTTLLGKFRKPPIPYKY